MAERFRLGDFAYAHRGLWSPAGPAENSLQACMDAGDAGLGIEFDVRPSRDGIPMVFHDATLDRMTAARGGLEDVGFQDLACIELLGGGGFVITLQTLLDAWKGVSPLLCELKVDGATDAVRFADVVGSMLAAYQGPVAAMSFSPLAVASLPVGLMRGQLIDAAARLGEPAFSAALSEVTPSHADYIACHTHDVVAARRHADRVGLPLITWTVRDPQTSTEVAPFVDAQIFEGFDPCLVKRSPTAQV